MNSTPSNSSCDAAATDRISSHRDTRALLRSIVHDVGHLLPAQGPIGVFVHHNTLHAFQHLPFEDAVEHAAHVYDTAPYMKESAYRAAFLAGRIRARDVDEVLSEGPDSAIGTSRFTRRSLRRAMLMPAGMRAMSSASIRFALDEERAHERLRSDLSVDIGDSIRGTMSSTKAAESLWGAVTRRVPHLDSTVIEIPIRPREGVLQTTGIDLDDVVHPLLIRLLASFLDQGVAYWPMPDRERGLYVAARGLLSQRGAIAPPGLEGIAEALRDQMTEDLSAEDTVLAMMTALGVSSSSWETFLTAELFALRGYAGLIARLEDEPSLAPHIQMPTALMDYLALRLTLVSVASANALADVGLPRSSWATSSSSIAARASLDASAHDFRVFTVFDAAQLVGLSGAAFDAMDDDTASRFVEEVFAFSDVARRRLWHLAYERRHEHLILGPLWQHRASSRTAHSPEVDVRRPRAQVFCCIDDREESFRRHLEELAPDVDTFGAAGFFGIAVAYTGIDDANGAALCPVVMKPQHAVHERAAPHAVTLEASRRRRRRLWADIARGWFVGSRTLVRGTLATAVLGVFALIPMTSAILAPRFVARLRARMSSFLLPNPDTELTFARNDDAPMSGVGELNMGFTVSEKANRVASVLIPAGLTENFARVVCVLGHGSQSLNNPHASAYDCGACGGRRGGANARLFALMANSKEVRARLRTRGLDIPDDVHFVGGLHDTCNDSVVFFDEKAIPSSHRQEVAELRALLHDVGGRDAHERVRRFASVSPNVGVDQALAHVQGRAEHLAEPRPEYGHSSNAACVIGRRETTRGLFLDRRAFLVSYDAKKDPDNASLMQLLAAAIPVCAGINLEYYFSFVDNEGYGCGTKLPHNVTGLMGVMNGHASDLRPGLTWQMVEIHEPVRLLVVVETTPDRLTDAVNANPSVRELVENRWIRVATLDPDTGAVHVRRESGFVAVSSVDDELPSVARSVDWYRGHRDHLPVAEIRPPRTRDDANGAVSTTGNDAITIDSIDRETSKRASGPATGLGSRP